MSLSPSTSTDSPEPKTRVVLVTGAAKRIGRGLALGFAARGWDVAVHFGGSEGEAQEGVQSIRALGPSALALHADLRVVNAVARLVTACIEAFGSVYCVGDNAARIVVEPPPVFSFYRLV